MGVVLVTQNASQEDQGNTALATEETSDSSNKIECFNYTGEWANA